VQNRATVKRDVDSLCSKCRSAAVVAQLADGEQRAPRRKLGEQVRKPRTGRDSGELQQSRMGRLELTAVRQGDDKAVRRGRDLSERRDTIERQIMPRCPRVRGERHTGSGRCAGRAKGTYGWMGW
jgi:hypothetical protein